VIANDKLYRVAPTPIGSSGAVRRTCSIIVENSLDRRQLDIVPHRKPQRLVGGEVTRTLDIGCGEGSISPTPAVFQVHTTFTLLV